MGKKGKKRRKRKKSQMGKERRGHAPKYLESIEYFLNAAEDSPQHLDNNAALYALGHKTLNRIERQLDANVLDLMAKRIKRLPGATNTEIATVCATEINTAAQTALRHGPWPFPSMFIACEPSALRAYQLEALLTHATQVKGCEYAELLGYALYERDSERRADALILCFLGMEKGSLIVQWDVSTKQLESYKTHVGLTAIAAMFLDTIRRQSPITQKRLQAERRLAQGPKPKVGPPNPLPEHYHEINATLPYRPSTPNPETKGTGTPLRYSHQRRSTEQVRVKRGPLPITDRDRTNLLQRRYRIFPSPAQFLPEADIRRLEYRGIQLKQPDEWIALLVSPVRAAVVRPDLPAIPSVRRV